MNQKLRALVSLAALALVLVWCIPSVGQVIKGSMSGSVTDPSGAVVSGAKVRARNVETGAAIETTTDSSGNFRLNLLSTGTYTVEITASGFKTAAQSSVVVAAGSDSSLGTVRMVVGEASTTVEVTAEAPLMEASQAQVSNTFSGTTLTEFAGVQENEGMDRIALFVPGVVATRQNNFSNTNGVGFSVSGLRGRSNDQEVDGQNNNDNSVGGPALQVSDDNFVQQYVLVTNNFGPEYGRNAGSVVNVITKSGSNAWHGSVYGTEQSNFFNALTNTQKRFNGITGPPRFNQEFSGGTIGGAILKNKLFLFNGLDNQLFSGNSVYSTGALTPTPAGLATLAGCGAAINPNALAVISNFGPYAFSAGGPTPSNTQLFQVRNAANAIVCPNVQVGTVSRTLSTPVHQFNWIERVDLQQGSDTISARFLMRRNNSFNNNDNGAGGWVQNTTALSQGILASWTHSLTAHMVNEARISYSRLNVQFGGNNIGNTLEPAVGQLTQAFTNISFQTGGFLGIGPATNLPQGRIVNTWQAQDNWNWVLGKHSIKAGVNWTYQRSPNVFLPNVNGQFRFTNFSSFITSDVANRILIGNGPTSLDFREYDTFLYAGDDWKLTPHLTLNLGLTWTYFGQPANLFNSITTPRESDASTAFWTQNPAVPLGARTDPKIPAIRNSFGPSVGFAYSPQWGGFLTGNGKTTFRGGYRLSYDPAFYNIFLNVSTSAPFIFSQTLTAAGVLSANPLPANPTGPNVRNLLNSSITPGVFDPRTFTQTTVAPDFKPDQVHSWSFGVQREVTKKSVLEARYVGNHATNLFQTVDGNPYVGTAAAPGLAQTFPNLVPAGVTGCTTPGVVQTAAQALAGPNPALGRVDCNQGLVGQRNNGAFSNYHALQVEFRAADLFKQLSLRTGYTWSKVLDNSSEIFSTGAGGNTLTIAQNPFNTQKGEYSISGLNVPNAWTISFAEKLPFFKEQHGFLGHVLGGWGIDGTYILASGQPFTPTQQGEGMLTTCGTATATRTCDLFGAQGVNYYDAAFVQSFGGADSVRPFIGNMNAPINSVGIFAADLCMGLLGIKPANNAALPGACNTAITPANALLSLNSLNINPANPQGGAITGVGRKPGETPVMVTPNDVRFIVNGAVAQQLFGTPFGNAPRNGFSDAIQNTANLSIVKNFKLSERMGFEFRATAINVMNHFNFVGVDPVLETAGRTGNGTGFGNPSLTNANGRVLLFGGTFTF